MKPSENPKPAKVLSDKLLTFNRGITTAILAKFNDAAMARSGDTQHYENGLDSVIQECHDARRGKLSPDEIAVADELSHIGLEIAKRKAIAASEFIVDLVRNSIEQPLLEPTPVPELPEDIKKEILVKMKQELLINQFSGDLRELATSLKTQAMGTAMDRAKLAAQKTETKLRDHLADANYLETNRQIIDDFVSMPFACAKYPSFEQVDTPYWNKNKWGLKRETKPRIKRINPANFYILNGTTAQNAEAVFEVAHVREDMLMSMKGKAGWRDAEIDVVLSGPQPQLSNQKALQTFRAVDPEQAGQFRLASTDTRELIWGYFRMRGADLLELEVDKYGDVKIEDGQSYEVCSAVYKDTIVHLTALPTNSPSFRPYHVASYESINGHWAGTGVIQRVLKASRVARSFMYAAVRNAGYSATPSGEIDYSRIAEFYPDQDELNRFNAGHMYLTSPDRTGSAGGKAAVSFYNVPNQTASLLSGMKIFMDLVDLLAAIPKVGAGDLSGQSTLGRSYRGVALVMQAEAKTIKSALLTFDNQIQEPVLQAMFYNLMETSTDPLMHGDATIIARSTSGYLLKESQAAARSETLNAAVGLAQAGLIEPGLLQSLVRQVLVDQGVDVDAYEAKKDLAAAGGQGANTQPPGGEAVVAAPDGAAAQTGVTGTDGKPIAA